MAFVLHSNYRSLGNEQSRIGEAAQECTRARQSSCWNEFNVVMLIVQGLQVPRICATLASDLVCSSRERDSITTSKLAASTLHMRVTPLKPIPFHGHILYVKSHS